jgi:hypothetical protein
MGDDGEFAGVLLGRLAQGAGQAGRSAGSMKLGLTAQPDEEGAELDDVTADEAPTGGGLPVAVAAWLAASPGLDPIVRVAAPQDNGSAASVMGTPALALPATTAPAGNEISAPETDLGDPIAPAEGTTGEDSAVSIVDAPATGVAETVAESEFTDPAIAPVSAEGADGAEIPVAAAAQGAVETGAETGGSTDPAPPASSVDAFEADDPPPPVPAPGRHVEQSNRPDALPGDAGRNAVEVLQRVAAKHEEQGKAPPGQQAGGNGMPTVAANASVVRSVGNADTGTSTTGGGSQREKHGDEGRATATAAIAAAGPAASAPSESATAAAEVAPPPAPVSEPPLEQVGRAVLERVSEGGGEARIRLDPPELGEVAIRVRIENHQVRVDIRVERPEALQLLRNAQVDLSSLLGERGLNLTGMFTTLSHGQSGSAWGDHASQQNQRSQDQGFAAILGIDETGAAINQHRKLRGVYNPDGAYDYRV